MNSLWDIMEMTFDICEFCSFYPPSSFDGKPCSFCQADGRPIKTFADKVRAMTDEEMKQNEIFRIGE